MKRIGLVLISVPSYSETFFWSKIKGLQEHGFEVNLFVTYASDQIPPAGCVVHSSPSFKKFSISTFYQILRAFFKLLFFSPLRSLELFRLDIKDGNGIITCLKNLILNEYLISKELDWIHYGFGTLAVGRENVSKVMRAKMGVSFRGFDLYISPLKHKNLYETLFKKDIRYHVLSHEMKDDLVSQGISENKIHIIPPAIDTLFFKKETDIKNNSKIQLLTVARLHWKKGLEYTLEALKKLKDQDISFEYTIIGMGEEFERLKFAACQLGIGNQVHFIGKQPPNIVRDFMSKSDIYLQYSIQEGFCNSVLEAQAMELLCIVSDAEGLPENVMHTKTGWVVPKRQPQLLADKILEVVELDNKIKSEVSQNARLRVEKEFDLKWQKAKFINFYSD